MTDLTLRGKIINLIEESRIDFKYNRDIKGDLSETKDLSREKCTQLEDRIYKQFVSRKTVVVIPYLMLSGKIWQVPKTVKKICASVFLSNTCQDHVYKIFKESS